MLYNMLYNKHNLQMAAALCYEYAINPILKFPQLYFLLIAQENFTARNKRLWYSFITPPYCEE